MGVYATIPLEPLPPLYTFDTKSKSESNSILIIHGVKVFQRYVDSMELFADDL